MQFEHLEVHGSCTLKPGLENCEHYFTSMWDECNCAVVWAFFGIAFLWDWNENWPFPVLRPLLSFPHLLAYWVQRFHFVCLLLLLLKMCFKNTCISFLGRCPRFSPGVLNQSLTVMGKNLRKMFFTSWLGDSYTTNIWELLFLGKIYSFLLGVFVHVPCRYKL